MRANCVFSSTSAYLNWKVKIYGHDLVSGQGEVSYPRGSCLYSVFLRVPAVQTRPSSLHLLHGNSPSHWRRVSGCAAMHNSVRSAGKPTLVFFMRHRSQAFHTLLCRPSTAACEWCETCSDALMWVLDRFEEPGLRCVDLDDLEFDVLLLGAACFMWSSIGGVARPLDIVRG